MQVLRRRRCQEQLAQQSVTIEVSHNDSGTSQNPCVTKVVATLKAVLMTERSQWFRCNHDIGYAILDREGPLNGQHHRSPPMIGHNTIGNVVKGGPKLCVNQFPVLNLSLYQEGRLVQLKPIILCCVVVAVAIVAGPTTTAIAIVVGVVDVLTGSTITG